MKIQLASVMIALGTLASGVTFAQVAASAPAGSTGSCKDGSYTQAATKKGACSKHGGVKDWFVMGVAPTAAPSAPIAAAPVAPVAPAAPAAPVAPVAPGGKTNAPVAAPSVAGVASQVWVNTASKVYHCKGDANYGTTKDGVYMTEAAARSAGDRPDHGKACS